MNDRDDYDLVESAPASTVERYVEQLDKLDLLILTAKASQSIESEAIATERLAQLYLEWGKDKVADVYLQEAYDLYSQAGVTTKTDYLEYTYPQLFAPSEPPNYFTDEFIATLSHEFRNPLNGILGMSEALLEEVFGTMNERQLNAVTTIDRSGGYLLALINNMVDLSQLQAGKLELDITQVTVAELCNFSVNFVKHHAIQKQIQLDIELPPNIGYVAVDLQRMRQVLIDLLERAIESTPAGGKVKLTVAKQLAHFATATSAIQFSVSDTSKEISPEGNDRVARISANTNTPRIGFGLMLVHPIVELHGGTIDFQSAIGSGSRVNICLPDTCEIASQTLDSPSRELRNSEKHAPLHSAPIAPETPELPLILIVEDNELNINTISSYLTAKGYRPIVAGDGESAIAMLEGCSDEPTPKFRPDLILMDIQMPGMDGFETISCIRARSALADIPIIALTALAMEGDRDKCLAAGANDYLTKPVKLKQLNATIQQFLTAKFDNSSLSGDLWG